VRCPGDAGAAVTTRVGAAGEPIRKEDWMLRRLGMFALAAAFIWPGALVAQEEMQEKEETPPMLVISSWKCDWGDVGTLAEDWNERGMNAAQAAIEAGQWYSAGVYYHDWADEYNVNYWAVGPSEASLIEGQEASNASYDEMYGEEGTNPWDHCSEHKDSFYQLAPNTTGAEGQQEGPEMAISSWKCTDVGAVYNGWMDYSLARAQAVVDSGQWNEAGVFFHTWGSEWNVNFYYMGDDIASIIAGWEAFIGSFDEDAPNITDYCSEHKDGFYSFGPTAKPEGEMEGD
jgi:hypothetical protein